MGDLHEAHRSDGVHARHDRDSVRRYADRRPADARPKALTAGELGHQFRPGKSSWPPRRRARTPGDRRGEGPAHGMRDWGFRTILARWRNGQACRGTLPAWSSGPPETCPAVCRRPRGVLWSGTFAGGVTPLLPHFEPRCPSRATQSVWPPVVPLLRPTLTVPYREGPVTPGE